MLCDYWAETCRGAVPSWRPTSQLLSFSSLLWRLQHWAADAVAHRQPVKHSFFCTVALFCLLTPFFLQSQSPFSISIRRHPSAKCISAFSGYPSITVSALRNTELTAAAAAWRGKALDATTRPSTWCFYKSTSLNVKLTNKCETAIHQLYSSAFTTVVPSNFIPKYSPWLSAAPCVWGLERFNGTPIELKSANWQNRCLDNTLRLSIKKMKIQFQLLLGQGDPLSFNY